MLLLLLFYLINSYLQLLLILFLLILSYKQNPNYSFFEVFGCFCFPLLKPYNSRKFDFRSHECLYLGHSTRAINFYLLISSNFPTLLCFALILLPRHTRLSLFLFPLCLFLALVISLLFGIDFVLAPVWHQSLSR